MASSLKQKTMSGIVWSSLERFSVQGIQFIIQLVMARILLPSDYGLIGMLTIFLAIAQSFVDSGFTNALVRKPSCSAVDFSTVFYFNIVIGVLFYLLLYAGAPWIAQFYNEPLLTDLTRVVGITVVANSLTIVQRARFTIRIDFKTQAKAAVIAVLFSGAAGLWMAYAGYGVWAIAVQSVVNSVLNMILLWLYSGWMPGLSFSWASFREMFSFGSKLLLSGLIDTVYKNIYALVIGKKFTARDLGFYTRADQFAQFPSANITGIISRVTFPVLSGIQDDDERLKHVYRKYIRLSAFVVFPLMAGLAALAQPLIHAVLTSKWDGVVLLLQLLCFSFMWYPIHAINLNLLQVKGHSDLFLRLEIIKKTVGVSLLCITIPLGVAAMCGGLIVSSWIGLFINSYYSEKLIGVGLIRQIRDIMPILVCALCMCLVVWLSVYYIELNGIKLLVGTIAGVLFYLVSTRFICPEELGELLTIVKNKF